MSSSNLDPQNRLRRLPPPALRGRRNRTEEERLLPELKETLGDDILSETPVEVEARAEHSTMPAEQAPEVPEEPNSAAPAEELPYEFVSESEETSKKVSEADKVDLVTYIQGVAEPLLEAISRRVVGQEELKQSLLISLLTNGHLLLESLPGLAKTTAAAALAKALSSDFKRIQCTPDLLPADIIGTQVYNNKTNEFTTQLGPVHANIVLLDEINRSSAKTQSAMLEAMQERQTSIGGEVYLLPKPFLVLATQNPIEQEGTYRLPEAQLDRFLMKELLTYPTPEEELEIVEKIENGDLDDNRFFTTEVTTDHILFSQELVKQVYVSEKVKQYIVHIVSSTRNPENVPKDYADKIEEGASPRATIAFLKASQALAALKGRDHVIPDDIKELAHRILRHRIKLNYTALSENITVEDVIDAILDSIKIA